MALGFTFTWSSGHEMENFIVLGFLGCQQTACQLKREISPTQSPTVLYYLYYTDISRKTVYTALKHYIAPIVFQPTSYKQALLQAPPPHCIL